MNYLFFDLAIAAALLFTVWRGYQRGFVLTLCGFLAIFVAFIGANFLSEAMAQPVSDLIRPAIEQRITAVLQDSLDAPPAVPDGSIPDGSAPDGSVPAEEGPSLSLEEVLDSLKDTKLYQTFAKAINDAVSQGMLEGASNAAKAVSAYIALQLAKIALFILGFLLILLLWSILSHALDLAFKLPVLSSLNHWAGGALGLLKGGLLVFIAVWLFGDMLPADAMRETVLLKFFCTTSPLGLAASFLQPK